MTEDRDTPEFAIVPIPRHALDRYLKELLKISNELTTPVSSDTTVEDLDEFCREMAEEINAIVLSFKQYQQYSPAPPGVLSDD